MLKITIASATFNVCSRPLEVNVGTRRNYNFILKVKKVKAKVLANASYMSQTHDQKRFTISKWQLIGMS